MVFRCPAWRHTTEDPPRVVGDDPAAMVQGSTLIDIQESVWNSFTWGNRKNFVSRKKNILSIKDISVISWPISKKDIILEIGLQCPIICFKNWTKKFLVDFRKKSWCTPLKIFKNRVKNFLLGFCCISKDLEVLIPKRCFALESVTKWPRYSL